MSNHFRCGGRLEYILRWEEDDDDDAKARSLHFTWLKRIVFIFLNRCYWNRRNDSLFGVSLIISPFLWAVTTFHLYKFTVIQWYDTMSLKCAQILSLKNCGRRVGVVYLSAISQETWTWKYSQIILIMKVVVDVQYCVQLAVSYGLFANASDKYWTIIIIYGRESFKLSQ